jgi:hypothetical protein|tara:strand:+ start:387 stop:569 length:183 start_codon:yes stop_codon:yes gene_type:complete
MTRKDYIKIADILRDHKLACDYETKQGSYNFETLVFNFCYMLKQDNIDFDKQKFIDAVNK